MLVVEISIIISIEVPTNQKLYNLFPLDLTN